MNTWDTVLLLSALATGLLLLVGLRATAVYVWRLVIMDPKEAARWFVSKGFVLDETRWCIAWSQRSGIDFTDLEFFPIDRGHWWAIVEHHASGANPRLQIGTCETFADVQMVYHTIRLINGYKQTEPERDGTA